MAAWEKALADNDDPEKMQNNIKLLFNAINDGVVKTYKLVSSLEDIEKEHEPPEHHRTIKIGRNDPCPCGSGKKYKKCCLH